MKRTLAAVAAAALIGVAGAANATDMYAPASLKDQPVIVPPPTWTGFYIGAHVGGFWSDVQIHDRNNWLGNGPGWGWTNDNDGVFGGGTVGYNYQVSNWGIGSGSVVIGFEADFGAAGLNRTWQVAPAFEAKEDGNFYADVTGRLGYAVGPALFYAKGGWAFLDADVTFRTPVWSVNHNGLDGWTVGGGIEYAWTPNWSVKGEYLHFDFSKITADGVFGVNTWGFDHDLFVNSVKVGLNYHFNAPYIPLK